MPKPRPSRARRAPSSPPGPSGARLSLERALSKFGFCSRGEARRVVEAGRVTVNGQVVLFALRRIDAARDRVCVDGQRVSDKRRRVTVAYHKPVGLITSRTDPGGRPTIYDGLGDLGRWLFPVGRLDKDSSGLLILTNDHRLGQLLTDPGHAVPKRYHARVRGLPDEQALQALREGVPLEDGLTRPAEVRALGAQKDGSSWLEIVLREGKNRQIRRMCAALGHDVLELTRVQIGGLELGELGPGEWRELPADEVLRLERHAC